MQIIVDMNLSPDWVEVLAREGFEARHWSDLGPANASDEEILNHALAEGAVILTHDLDFGVPSWRPRAATHPVSCRSEREIFRLRASRGKSFKRFGKPPMDWLAARS